MTGPPRGCTAYPPDRQAGDPDVPFADEIAAAVREEKRISARLLLALAVVALVICARLLFF